MWAPAAGTLSPVSDGADPDAVFFFGPSGSPVGALDRWRTYDPAARPGEPDAISGASPMGATKAAALAVAEAEAKVYKAAADSDAAVDRTKAEYAKEYKEYLDTRPSYRALLFGRMSGTLGVTSALLILIGGLILFVSFRSLVIVVASGFLIAVGLFFALSPDHPHLWTWIAGSSLALALVAVLLSKGQTASKHIVLSTVLTYLALNQLLHWAGVAPVPGGLTATLGGGFLFGAFFMATDPVSAADTKPGQVIYGALIATSTVVIRNFSIFNGGLMFSILIGNMFAPVIDRAVRAWNQQRGT
jgi:Na+-transporting NADH:ubiquinone oxidoreductase subunit NqrB